MLTYFVLFCIISFGSLVISSFFGSRFEEGLPLSFFSIITILYLFGLINLLMVGIYFVSTITVVLTIFTFYHEIKKKQLKALISRVFTPAFFMFAGLAIAIVAVSYNRLVNEWDEYSHWAYIVKAMVQLNSFGTHPLAHAIYFDYPPAMALLQYFTMVLHGGYEEWLLYASYLLVATSLFLPFLKHLRFRSVLYNTLIFAIIVFLPTLFFMDYYVNLQIDKFLGLLFGFSMATLFQKNGTKDSLSRLTLLFSIFILVLTKPSGVIFAAFVLFSFLVDLYRKRDKETLYGESMFSAKKEKLYWGIASVGIFIFAVASWACCVMFSKTTETLEIANMSNTFHGISADAGAIVQAFLKQLAYPTERLGFLHISDIAMMAGFFALLLLTGLLYREKNRLIDSARKVILIEFAAFTIVYFGSILLSYLTAFSLYDALRLASYERYSETFYLSLLFFFFVIMIPFYYRLQSKKAKIAMLVAAFFILAPYAYFRSPHLLPDKQLAITEHEQYESITDEIKTVIGKVDANVYIVAQNTRGYEWLVLRYFLYPIHAYGYWSLGPPNTASDIYTANIEFNEWRQNLVDSYNYLYIYQCDTVFINYYGKAFSNLSEISSNRLYRLNPESDLLELICEP